jgi:hypothetical protein
MCADIPAAFAAIAATGRLAESLIDKFGLCLVWAITQVSGKFYFQQKMDFALILIIMTRLAG